MPVLLWALRDNVPSVINMKKEYTDLAFQFLARPDLNELKPGRYAILDDKVFATIAETTLKPLAEAKLEVHAKYADIQMPLSGEETFGYRALTAQEASLPVDPIKDIAFLESSTMEYKTIKPREYVVFRPGEAHAPCLTENATGSIHRKVIVKILEES